MPVTDFDALLVVDMQNDFCDGGALAVGGASEVILKVNDLLEGFHAAGLPIIGTQDFHPADHKSFASQHEGVEVYDVFTLSNYPQVAWPDHCVQGTFGAEFHPDVKSEYYTHVIHKGCDVNIDSYSAFFDNARLKDTGLDQLLKDLCVKTILICGLATDYCVLMSALDSAVLGYKTFVAADATAPVNQHPTDYQRSLDEMRENGCIVITVDAALRTR